MKSRTKKLAFLSGLAGFILSLGGHAQAASSMGNGFNINLGTFYSSITQAPSGSSTTSSTQTYLDLKAGYWWSNAHFGVLYSSYADTTTTTQTRSGMGLYGGYHNSGFFVDLSYQLLNAVFQVTSSDKLEEGTVLGVDFGHNWMVGSNFYLGLQLAYKSFEYKKVNSSGTVVSATNAYTDLRPMINLGFFF